MKNTSMKIGLKSELLAIKPGGIKQWRDQKKYGICEDLDVACASISQHANISAYIGTYILYDFGSGTIFKSKNEI